MSRFINERSTRKAERFFLLQRRPFAEFDDIVTGIGELSGKFSAVVKGGRKQRSRLAGLLEPPVELLADFREGSGLSSMSSPRLNRGFVRLKSRLDSLLVAGFLSRLLLACLPEKFPAPDAFELIEDFLLVLGEHPLPQELAYLGQYRILSLLGLAPELDSCLGCGGGSLAGFSPKDGGVLCRGCYRGSGFSLGVGSLTVLRGLARQEFVGASLEVPSIRREVSLVLKQQFVEQAGVSPSLFRRVLGDRGVRE